MKLHEEYIFKITPLKKGEVTQKNNHILANEALSGAVTFLNQVIVTHRLTIPRFPADFDPSHSSRWLYFFLRETIRNSIDALCLLEESDVLPEIKITLVSKGETGQLYLAVKDNGVGFSGVDKGVYLDQRPRKTQKDKEVHLGGKGFGLGLCADKFTQVLFKNRKEKGASVSVMIEGVMTSSSPA